VAIIPQLYCTVLILNGMVSVEHLANYHIVKNHDDGDDDDHLS